MIKQLVKHGNSHAIVVDKTIMELLEASPQTQFRMMLDGESLRLLPLRCPAVNVTSYMDDIQLTATDNNAPWRIGRLMRVIGYVKALADHYGNGDLLKRVTQLHDGSGILQVTWSDTPTDGERDFFLKAWSSDIGDGTKDVDHAC